MTVISRSNHFLYEEAYVFKELAIARCVMRIQSTYYDVVHVHVYTTTHASHSGTRIQHCRRIWNIKEGLHAWG